jgi:predicted nucleic acid-binding protein
VRAIFALVDSAEIDAFSSVVTLTEVLTMPLAKGNTVYEQAYVDMLLNSNGITLIPVSISIARRAAELRARHNLRTPDAIHVATALEAGCQAFLTNDLGLKRVSEIRILMLDELELDETPDEE